VTLRGRLTAAFLAVVLGPVLLGAVFAGATVSAVNRTRSVERLDLAADAVQSTVGALCGQLRAGAQAAAVLTQGGRDPQAAAVVVAQGMAGAVRLQNAAGDPVGTSGNPPPPPWALCEQPGVGSGYAAIAARVEMRDPNGGLVGYAYAMQPIDSALLRRFGAAAGVSVTLLGDDPRSTDPADQARTVSAVASRLNGAAIGETRDGRYVRRLPVVDGQPLPLAVSAGHTGLGGQYPILLGIVLLAGAAAIVAAWWLARGTTRPLAELALAAGRVADGDLAARVPVRSRDEVGRLAGTFNRMTREMQAYVEALTASRDQLRGNLGLLGDTLSSTHDLQRILTVILQTARSATGAQSGVVLLVDPASATLSGSDLSVPLGAGLLGSVAVSGEARRGRIDRDGPVLDDVEPRCRTYMAVPFNAPGEGSIRGVLALYDRLGDDEFDDTDLVTLRTFAGQAAIAVENVRVHEEAQRLSHTDPLTGLHNYRMLKDSLRREVERASRFGHQLCVLMLDLDRFKEVNDSYGHPAGDLVLAEFARRLASEIREVDLAFRQGGEEFVVLLPETEAIGGITVAQRLGTAIRATPIIVPGRLPAARSGAPAARRIAITVSIGIAVFPDHGSSGTVVLDAADEALYAAKAAGRDTYRLAHSRVDAGTGGASNGPRSARPARGR
jgi:diguanylate cyclase (GGDEF)-like protein